MRKIKLIWVGHMTNPFLFDKNPQNKLKVYLKDIKLSQSSF